MSHEILDFGTLFVYVSIVSAPGMLLGGGGTLNFLYYE